MACTQTLTFKNTVSSCPDDGLSPRRVPSASALQCNGGQPPPFAPHSHGRRGPGRPSAARLQLRAQGHQGPAAALTKFRSSKAPRDA